MELKMKRVPRKLKKSLRVWRRSAIKSLKNFPNQKFEYPAHWMDEATKIEVKSKWNTPESL